jgi:hypothetical protein
VLLLLLLLLPLSLSLSLLCAAVPCCVPLHRRDACNEFRANKKKESQRQRKEEVGVHM